MKQNPAASSKSCPGVRIVVDTTTPSSWMVIGSSTMRSSGRRRRPVGVVVVTISRSVRLRVARPASITPVTLSNRVTEGPREASPGRGGGFINVSRHGATRSSNSARLRSGRSSTAIAVERPARCAVLHDARAGRTGGADPHRPRDPRRDHCGDRLRPHLRRRVRGDRRAGAVRAGDRDPRPRHRTAGHRPGVRLRPAGDGLRRRERDRLQHQPRGHPRDAAHPEA